MHEGWSDNVTLTHNGIRSDTACVCQPTLKPLSGIGEGIQEEMVEDRLKVLQHLLEGFPLVACCCGLREQLAAVNMQPVQRSILAMRRVEEVATVQTILC